MTGPDVARGATTRGGAAVVDGDRDDAQGVRQVYEASYARLVGVVGAVCGDRSEAEEAVQDAFVKLIGAWPTVRRYDDPEGWVRLVALRLASNRRRKALNGLRAALRHGPPPDAPAPSAVEVDLDRALARLPAGQRAVIVLHRLGLDVETIARELSVPVGTVKSRLARARAALAPLLREDVTDSA